MNQTFQPSQAEADPEADDVTEARLAQAYKIFQLLIGKLGPDWCEYVLVQLGMTPYVDVLPDGRWKFHDLTALQTVALAAALAALNERINA